MKKITKERINGTTPNGGAYSVAYYSDGEGHACDKSKASRVEIVEYSSKGEALARHYGMCH